MSKRKADEEVEAEAKKLRKEEQAAAAREQGKRSIDEHEKEEVQSDKSWKKKKLNWLRTINKIPGVTPINRVQVVELYSPERVNKVAKEHGMITGLSLDLLTGWNFDQKEDRDLAEKYVRDFEPLFVIGSPMCTMFSQLQALNRSREGTRSEDYEERMRRAEKHMNFAVRIYRI